MFDGCDGQEHNYDVRLKAVLQLLASAGLRYTKLR